MLHRFAIALLFLTAAAPTQAAQTLMPTPYPSAAPGVTPLNPTTPGGEGGGQQIMRDPYPQTTGAASQGNPTTTGHRVGGQRLVPSTNQRKYGVDRAPR